MTDQDNITLNTHITVKTSLKVIETGYVTHDVKRFVLEKPPGFSFTPGQSANISINQPEWKHALRPFTFTSLPEDDYIEFMIKIYRNRNGVTKMLESINEGDELILHDVFGVLHFKEKGVFIAAGSGITPFLSILRHLHKTRRIHVNSLIYSNRTVEDVIYDDELERMLGDNFIKTFTRENVIGFIDRRIDRNFLIENVDHFKQHFYICGPGDFVRDLNILLQSLGASPEFIIFEQ